MKESMLERRQTGKQKGKNSPFGPTKTGSNPRKGEGGVT